MPGLNLMNHVPGSELQDRLLRKSETVAEGKNENNSESRWPQRDLNNTNRLQTSHRQVFQKLENNMICLDKYLGTWVFLTSPRFPNLA
jgi:hypothetical protein